MRTVITRSFPASTSGLLCTICIALIVGFAAPVMAEPPLQMTPAGVQFRDLSIGEGEPVTPGEKATVHIVMWLSDNGQKGKELYNSRGDREAISFIVGTGYMMPAINEGVLGMRPGGKRLLVVPPAFAYGERGLADVVPPESSVILLIDLLSAGQP